tara:strand:- start:754 stop:1965 length:1212 start_codon:yes stop_codon:yes gene_type:complete
MAGTIITGIDAGDYAVKIIVAETRTDRKYPRLLAAISQPSRGIRRGQIIDPQEAKMSVSAAISAAEKQSGIKIKRAYTAIDGETLSSHLVDGSIIVSRADSEITEYDLRRIVEVAEEKIPDLPNREVLDIIPIQYKVDGKKILHNPTGMKGSKVEIKFLFITCLQHHLDDVVNTIEYNRVAIEQVLPAPVAASFVTLSKTQKIAGCVLADIGAGTTKIAVFEEGLLQSVESFEVGSQDVTNDIALGLKISLEEAEDLKVDRGSILFSDKKTAEIVEARLSDVFESIEGHLKKLGKNELLPAGIILTGGGSSIPKIDAFAQTFLNIPSKISLPLYPQNARIESQQGLSKEDSSRLFVKDPSFAVAYGLTVYGHNPKESMTALSNRGGSKSMFGEVSRFFRNFLP